MYGYVYIGLLVPLFVAVGLAIWFYISLLMSKNRAEIVDWAFLLAAIANIAVAIWVIVYINEILPGNHVKIPHAGATALEAAEEHEAAQSTADNSKEQVEKI